MEKGLRPKTVNDRLMIHSTAYMMVTCPVMDGVNGSHSHGGSPVPLKKYVLLAMVSKPIN